MGDILTPPTDAAHDAGVLLLWVCGLLLLAVVAQAWRLDAANRKYEAVIDKQGEQQAPIVELLTTVKIALGELRTGQTGVKEAVYALRDKLANNGNQS